MNVQSLSHAWRVFLAYNSALQPARISLILAILMPAVFLLVPQGRDIAIALGEIRWGDPEFSRVGWFFAALAFFGLANWFAPRFLLDCRFDLPGGHRDLLEGRKENLRRLKRYVPRFLGVAPIVALGVEFFLLALERNALPNNEASYGLLGTGCLALAGALYGFFAARRHVLNRVRMRRGLVPRQDYANLQEIMEDRLAVAGFGAFFLPAVFLFVIFTFWPVGWGLKFGSAAVLLAAYASWATAGGVLVYLGHRWGLPTMTLGIGLALIAGCWNDNHAVRELDPATTPRVVRLKLDEHLDAWHRNVSQRFPEERTHPLFIVITEGGGIRAAYWTTRVLAELEARLGEEFPEWQKATAPDGSRNFVFADHLLAVSGVSGGSLGAASFNLLLDHPSATPIRERVRPMLGQEFLAPLVGKMLYPDCVQRFIPWPVETFDRARALEMGWEKSWSAQCEPAESFAPAFDAYFRPKRFLPALFFNGTDVERGGRIVTSTVDFVGTKHVFVSARDGLALMENRPIPLSTAVHSSARFTYFSPAGRFPSGRHIVDGGYFENSGASTGLDLLRAVRAKGWDNVQPIVIVITNGSAADYFKKDWASREVMTPLNTLLATRPAHSSAAVLDLLATLLANKEAPVRRNFIFNMPDPAVPLGWTLSPLAVQAMENQFRPAKNSAPGEKPPPHEGELREIVAAMKTLRDYPPAPPRAAD